MKEKVNVMKDYIKREIFNKFLVNRLDHYSNKKLDNLWNRYKVGNNAEILLIIEKEKRKRYVNNILTNDVNKFNNLFGDLRSANMWINMPWKLIK